ncbi:Respiratory nitrate reductase 2 gamma chain [wastewater metagenome]|uniref:Respiratory nitrate reductase 2 gamma chain n=2 Tax=unclassified sequences TaxID=12908 RepID=A0A5B8R7A0_9ZZZZ|nr:MULTISPECIES: respiratory nitrate reductase subunit gamma [Arhodomonas]MCS4502661.1 respiratory nitrate reductase subunit gamma [Arhodomonas aquaeolei]QEA03858.1 respiratory nitrate reductase 2 gamma chain [uncultured organism]
MSFLNNLLFGYYPYIAGTVFLLGSIVRFDMSQYTWKTNSSQLFDSSRRFRIGNILFHVGIILLFFGHLVGLLMPHWMYPWFGLTPGSKQVMAMTAGGIFGTLALVGGWILIQRRLTNERVRANSSRMDTFIILLLYVQLVLGMLTIPVSATHLDGGTMLELADWAQHIVTFRPGAAEYIADVSLVFKLHLFLGLTTFLVFPFTRLVHIWSAPVWYLGRSYQLVRQRQG